MSATGPKGEPRIATPTAAERAIARRAAESRATVPGLELTVVRDGAGPVSTAHLLRACASALTEHPRANAAYRDGRFERYPRVNIGLVLSLPQSYLVPTVFDADRRSVDELARDVEELRTGAAAGALPASAFSGATFTVWNASEHEIAQASIPIVPPQAAALAAGTTSLTLTCDHRILYGAQAASFLTAARRHLEQLGR